MAILRNVLLLVGVLLCTVREGQAYPYQEPLRIKKEGIKFGLITPRGKVVLSPRYDSLQYTRHQDHFIAYLKKGDNSTLVGLINPKGKELIPIGFSSISPLAADLYAVENPQQQKALFNNEGDALSSFQFDEITAFKGKLARFYKEGRAGLLDKLGNIRIPAGYKDILIRNDSTVDVIELREWKVLDANNNLQHTLYYDSINPLGEGRWAAITRFYDGAGRPTDMTALTDANGSILRPYSPITIQPFMQGKAIIKEGGRYGLINRQGQRVLPSEWDALTVTQHAAVAGMKLGKNWYWHLFSLDGKKLSQNTFQHIDAQAQGPMPAKLGNQWGYIDSLGREILVCRYDSTQAFNGSYAQVWLNAKAGLINKQGRWQIRPYAEHIQKIMPNRFLLRLADGYQLTDESGLILYHSPYTLVWLQGRLAEVDAQQQWTLLSLDGKRLSAPGEFQWIGNQLENGLHLARKLGKIGLLQAEKRKFIAAGPDTFDAVFELKEDYFSVSKNGQQGFVDKDAKLRIANRYDSVTYFSEGMAAIRIRGKWGYINKLEQLKIQPTLEEAYAFSQGLAIARYHGQYGLLNAEGQWVLPAEYDHIIRLTNGSYVLKSGEVKGLATVEGQRVVSPKYDAIQDLDNTFLLVSRQGKQGLITTGGVSTIPLVYDILIYDQPNSLFLASQLAGKIRRINLKPLQ